MRSPAVPRLAPPRWYAQRRGTQGFHALFPLFYPFLIEREKERGGSGSGTGKKVLIGNTPELVEQVEQAPFSQQHQTLGRSPWVAER